MSHDRDERGHTTLLVIGFATMLLLTIAVVVNASAAYLQRQGLHSLADGAALQGADLGAAGVYEDGVATGRLMPEAPAVRAAVDEYLRSTGAARRFPGLTARVRIDEAERSVTVMLQAPLDLPLGFPGAPRRPLIGATSSAAVTVVD